MSAEYAMRMEVLRSKREELCVRVNRQQLYHLLHVYILIYLHLGLLCVHLRVT